MEKNEIVKIIDQITDYRNRRMKRDNIKWHLEKDIAGGWCGARRGMGGESETARLAGGSPVD